jgi:hypothetical protein
MPDEEGMNLVDKGDEGPPTGLRSTTELAYKDFAANLRVEASTKS